MRYVERIDDEMISEAEDVRLIEEFVDADSSEEEMDVVVMLIDLGMTRSQIRAMLVRTNEEIERGVWS